MPPNTPVEILQEAAYRIDCLSRTLRKNKNIQVRSTEELQRIKATALAWFNNYRKNLKIGNADLIIVDTEYSNLLKCASRSTSRDRYQEMLKKLKSILFGLQSQILQNQSVGSKSFTRPDFSPLAPNAQMQSS